MTAVDAQPWSPVTVTLEYPATGRRETLRFFVVEALGPDLVAPAAAQPWSPRYVSWAQGGHAAQRDYHQVGLYGCSSGCGATAWAMLFGWGDELAWQKLAPWTPRWGLHRVRGGADLRAPAQQDGAIDEMTRRIAIDMGSFCYGELRATPPWDMIDAAQELSGKTRATIRTNANYFGYGEKRLREIASEQITDQARPAIIGTGLLQHDPSLVRLEEHNGGAYVGASAVLIRIDIVLVWRSLDVPEQDTECGSTRFTAERRDCVVRTKRPVRAAPTGRWRGPPGLRRPPAGPRSRP